MYAHEALMEINYNIFSACVQVNYLEIIKHKVSVLILILIEDFKKSSIILVIIEAIIS